MRRGAVMSMRTLAVPSTKIVAGRPGGGAPTTGRSGSKSTLLPWVASDVHLSTSHTTTVAVELILAADEAGVLWLLEHPCSRRAPPARWEEHAWKASIWDFENVIALIIKTRAVKVHLAQCAFKGRYQKLTTILGAAPLEALMQQLLEKLCTCASKHAAIAKGRDEHGASMSAPAAAYPPELAQAFAAVAALGVQLQTGSSHVMCFASDADEAVPARAHVSAPPAPVRQLATTGGTSGVLSVGPRLHLGSARPHQADEHEHVATTSLTPAGSMRQQEPELASVLLEEPLELVNVVIATDWEQPPEVPIEPPGPFTNEELLPPGVWQSGVKFGQQTATAIARARAGPNGWHVAKRLRPGSIVLSEAEALNECGWGYRFRKRSDGLWHAVVPSSFPSNPPNTTIHAQRYLDLAEKHNLLDKQCTSWMVNGFPGSRHTPVFAQLAAPHVGALKNANEYVRLCEKDEKAGYVTHGHAFPDIWPCVIDPTNVVIQRGKGRLTVDKTMHVSGDPELPSYNLAIVLEVDEAGKRYKLVRIRVFSRACAILTLACLGTPSQLKVSKFDVKAFFRNHGKQHAHLHQSGRLSASGYGTSECVDFGECDAPDHMGRCSNNLRFFIIVEWKRLSVECRRGLRRTAAPQLSERDDLQYAVLFFTFFYVDDCGMAAVDYPIFDKHGPLLLFEYASDGSQLRRQQGYAELLFNAAVGVCEYLNYGTPEDKREYPGRLLLLIGHGVDLDLELQYLDELKATEYSAHVRRVLDDRRLPNGCLRHELKSFDSLTHRLLHACESIALGRPHLHHVLQSLRGSNRLDGTEAIISLAAERELEWWLAAMRHAKKLALPRQAACPSRARPPTECSSSTPTLRGSSSKGPTEHQARAVGEHGQSSAIRSTTSTADGATGSANTSRSTSSRRQRRSLPREPSSKRQSSSACTSRTFMASSTTRRPRWSWRKGAPSLTVSTPSTSSAWSSFDREASA